jgi:hypothetical protein
MSVGQEDTLERYIRYKNNPWDFAMECVKTKDQVDRVNPIKLLPNREYARLYYKLWKSYPLLLIPKTRRMTMSWFTIAIYTHDTIFNKGRFNAFVSKKEDDANELVERAKFIVDNIPEDKIPKEMLPRMVSKFNVLSFPDIESKIQGFPQGADQLRQFTFSGIFGDECAFWDQAQQFYSASFPTIEGGGRMTLVSSPAPGFFKKICFDALDDPRPDVEVASYSPAFQRPIEGVRVWNNKKNKFMVFELHYMADPGKRSPEFKESIKNSMPLQDYLREYELYWDTFAGQPVYPEFSKLHIMHKKEEPVAGLPMLIAFDFGLTPACVIGQYHEAQLTIFHEFVEVNMGAKRFVEKVTSELRLRYPTWGDFKKDWKCYIDPSGVFRSDTDESSCALILGKYFVPNPGPIAWEERRHAVVHFLQHLTPQGPAFQIDAKACPMLVKGFEGGYRFNEKNLEIEPTKIRPIKDQYSHPHDALQYLCSGVRQLSASIRKSIPKPSYSLTEGTKTWQR